MNLVPPMQGCWTEPSAPSHSCCEGQWRTYVARHPVSPCKAHVDISPAIETGPPNLPLVDIEGKWQLSPHFLEKLTMERNEWRPQGLRSQGPGWTPVRGLQGGEERGERKKKRMCFLREGRSHSQGSGTVTPTCLPPRTLSTVDRSRLGIMRGLRGFQVT